MDKIRIAVTGSSGFIGSRLVQSLIKADFDVLELDLKKGTKLEGDNFLKDIPRFDILIHLAAKSYVPNSYKNPLEFYSININTTLKALELCRKNCARLIFTSSYVYGVPQYLPIDEKHPVQSFNPYADTKLICENICQSYHNFFKVNIIIVRPFNVYGPNQNTNFLIPFIINQIKKGKIILENPKPKRDFIYIDDLIDFYIKVIAYKSPNIEIFNVGSGKSYSVKEIAEIVIKNSKFEIDLRFLNNQRDNEILETKADISKAKLLLGWEPKIDINQGIMAILNEIKNN